MTSLQWRLENVTIGKLDFIESESEKANVLDYVSQDGSDENSFKPIYNLGSQAKII